MNIDLYFNSSDPRKVHKNITQYGSTKAIQLLEPCSIESPVVIVQMDDNILTSNYAYIAHFGRYYYISDKTIIEGNKVRLSLKCDVLKTFFNSCGNSPIIAKRSSSHPDYRIADPRILNLPEPDISIRRTSISIPSATTKNFVLTVTGK
jgi:hypothetical protein